ncbi:hypothetical protein DET54_106220 [Paenibacillus pabuli]|uniref:Uncharacterized protein n=1 Tax=Paenibacillus pabuli TaxID=1472 RepID=A0ABX9BKA5_9BACL|nr:hypothetical protein DET54_106220 [Paenibacillus pabuli]
MSLCVSAFIEGSFYIWADGRICAQAEGTNYLVTDEYSKVRVFGKRVVFATGMLEIAESVFGLIKEDSSIEDIQRVARECYSTFKAANENDPLYQALEHGIELGVIVHEFDEGVPRYIQMVYDTDFDIRVTQPSNLDFFSFGAHSDDILPILIAKVNAGVEVSSAVEQSYAEIADASVGGRLQGFRFSNETLAHSNVWINDKTAYSMWKGNRLPCLADMQGNAVMNKLTANSAQINSSDFNNGAIVGSSINVGNGKFKVDTAGNMYTEGSTTVGGTITGSLIRTAASGRRVELDTQGLRSYDTAGVNRIRINTGSDNGIAAISFYGSGGASAGEINSYQNSGGLSIISSDVFIGSNNTGNPIRLQGAVTIDGTVEFRREVTGLNVGIGSVTGLQTQLDAIWAKLNNHTHDITLPTHNHGNSANQNWGGTFTSSRSA